MNGLRGRNPTNLMSARERGPAIILNHNTMDLHASELKLKLKPFCEVKPCLEQNSLINFSM